MELEAEAKLVPEEDEEEPYSFKNLSVQISINDYDVSLQSSLMEINLEGFTFLEEKKDNEWFTIYTAFANTTSVGISGNSLMVFVGDQEPEEDEKEPGVIGVIRASAPGGSVCLNGHSCTLSIDFGKEGKNVLK